MVHADGELEVVVWMNEIGARLPSFPAFLEHVLEMLGAEIAERQRLLGRAPSASRWGGAEPAPRCAEALLVRRRRLRSIEAA